MSRNPVETIMGAVVLLVAGFFVAFAWNISSVGTVKGYEVSAAFLKVGGLENGSDVRISGVKVGTVIGQRLDPETYDAVVVMSILPDIKLPVDTVAIITSEGMLGGKYVKLNAGAAKEYLAVDGTGVVAETKDFRSLEELVGDIIFLATQNGPGM